MSDVFISYGREDAEFVDRLREALVAHGDEVWVDRGGIEPSDRWMQSVREAIERSDAIVYVLSDDSLASKVCAEELEYAVSLNKRLIPICIQDPAEDAQIPSFVSELSWIMLRPSDDFERGIKDLRHALDTPRGRAHPYAHPRRSPGMGPGRAAREPAAARGRAPRRGGLALPGRAR
jgi:hypothetical protein